MKFKGLLKSVILEVLNDVWAETKTIPSKNTRQAILEAVEKISDEIQEDLLSNRSGRLPTNGWAELIEARWKKKELLRTEGDRSSSFTHVDPLHDLAGTH